MGALLRMLLAQREAWERREAEAAAWQGLSLALMMEVGAQLRASRFLSPGERGEDAAHVVGGGMSHDPYCVS